MQPPARIGVTRAFPIFAAVPVRRHRPRRIFLVRHGETLYGAGTGGTDDLTPEGYRQIRALELILRPIAIDAIYASPLERAQATARTLAGDSGVPVTTVDALREIMPGDLSVLRRDVAPGRRELPPPGDRLFRRPGDPLGYAVSRG